MRKNEGAAWIRLVEADFAHQFRNAPEFWRFLGQIKVVGHAPVLEPLLPLVNILGHVFAARAQLELVQAEDHGHDEEEPVNYERPCANITLVFVACTSDLEAGGALVFDVRLEKLVIMPKMILSVPLQFHRTDCVQRNSVPDAQVGAN